MLKMLARLFPDSEDSLTLVVGGVRQRFSTIAAFRKYLSQRIDVPDERRSASRRPALMRSVEQNVHCGASALEQALESHQRLVAKAMVEMLKNNKCIGPIDSRNFSRDHDWREIMESLNEQSSKFDAFKYEALKMYTHYMEARSTLFEREKSDSATTA
jgi:hypothetical protein